MFIIKQLDVRKHLWVSRVTSLELVVEIFCDVLPVYAQLNDTILQLNFTENIKSNNRPEVRPAVGGEGGRRRQEAILLVNL